MTEFGTIKTLILDKGFGFLTDAEGRDCFFHTSAVDGAVPFLRLQVGQAVEFERSLEKLGKGPRAGRVWVSEGDGQLAQPLPPVETRRRR